MVGGFIAAGIVVFGAIALMACAHEYVWVRDDPYLYYWIPHTPLRRAHNRELRMREKAYDFQRKARRCRSLATTYREDGDEMSAIVLDAEADDANRQALLSYDSMRAARMELRDIEYRELTGGG